MMKLIFCDWTHGVAMRTSVGIIVKESYVESKAAPAVSTVRNTRPIEAVAADTNINIIFLIRLEFNLFSRSRKDMFLFL